MSDTGWYGIKLIAASQASEVPGLEELATYVRLGMLARDGCYLVARRRTDAPYPDAVVAVALDPATLAAWRRGDRSAAAWVAEELERGYAAVMDRERGKAV